MTCPACGKDLNEQQLADLTVEVCDRGCGGVWFDSYELEKVDEAHESRGESLLDLGHRSVAVDHKKKRACPACDGVTMQRHDFSVRKEIEVDECPSCGGVWLDTGELAAIRSEFKTQAERRQAGDVYLSKLFDELTKAERAKNTEQLERAQKFAHVFRFICPSYWIPGKQAGGAY